MSSGNDRYAGRYRGPARDEFDEDEDSRAARRRAFGGGAYEDEGAGYDRGFGRGEVGGGYSEFDSPPSRPDFGGNSDAGRRGYGYGRVAGGRYEDDYARAHERSSADPATYARTRRGHDEDADRFGPPRQFAAESPAPRYRPRRDEDDYDAEREARRRYEARQYESRGGVGEGGGHGRGWWDRVSDEVASWFGEEEAERRRRMDESGGAARGSHDERMPARSYGLGGAERSSSARQSAGQFRGRGPRGYRRSDERIREDVSDRLTEHPEIDATDVEVHVENGEVFLSGTVDERRAKRFAEDIAESVSGVTHVENRLRVNRGTQLSAGVTGGLSESPRSEILTGGADSLPGQTGGDVPPATEAKRPGSGSNG